MSKTTFEGPLLF